jgi:hypothetical protein
MVQTVAIDFDGVIHSYDKGWQGGKLYGDPIPGAFDAIRLLMRTYAVFIHTSRDPVQVIRWIEDKSEIPYICQTNPGMEFWSDQGKLLVTNQKLPAAAYIDDRGIRFTDWTQALNDLSILVRRDA